MKLKTDKQMVVFNGELKSFAEIEAGEYEVEEIEPPDYVTEDYFAKEHQLCIRLIWVQIKHTQFITAFCRKKIPEGLTFTE